MNESSKTMVWVRVGVFAALLHDRDDVSGQEIGVGFFVGGGAVAMNANGF